MGRDGLMVAALDPGSSGPGSSFACSYCVVLLGNTLESQNQYQVDTVVCFVNTYELDSDLPGG